MADAIVKATATVASPAWTPGWVLVADNGAPVAPVRAGAATSAAGFA